MKDGNLYGTYCDIKLAALVAVLCIQERTYEQVKSMLQEALNAKKEERQHIATDSQKQSVTPLSG